MTTTTVFARSYSTAGSLRTRTGQGGAADGGSSITDELAAAETDDPAFLDIRRHIRVIDAFEQQQLTYNVSKMHFDVVGTPPSLFPPPAERTRVMRDRYNLVHQRLLRSDAFAQSSADASHDPSLAMQSGFRASKLTAIANLLGRSGSSHYVLGMLQAAPTGGMLLADLTGSVALDLTHARAVPEDGAWYTPGMFVIIYGVYEEDEVVVGAALASNQGVGGTIGGKFFAVVVAGPPCERREHTLGISAEEARGGTAVSAPALAAVPARLEGGYGWVDFLGVGSERAVGAQMRQLQARCLQKALSSSQADGSAGPARRRKIVILSELNLDVVSVTAALEKVLAHYSPAGDEDPMNVPPCFVLMGSFVQYSRMPGSDTPASDEYKHGFDSLAAVLARFPAVLRNSTFVFVPGDNDPWAAAHSGGASTPVPRDGLSKLFTARVNRAFAEANREVAGKRGRVEGKVVWASNPARICLFGPTKELVVFRDDMSGRLRRNAISLRGPAKDAGDTNMDVDEGADADADAHADAMEVDEPEAQPTVTSSADPTSPQQHQQQQQQDGPASSHTSVPPSLAASRKLVKTILDQGHLSPFPLLTRPVLAGYASALHLYPLPSALVLADSEASTFAITYEGCHVMNPGRLVPEGSKGLARWIEYDVVRNRGTVMQERF